MSDSLFFVKITTTNNTVNFLKNVGTLRDAFSIHERKKEYERFFLEKAHYCISSNCVTTLNINQQKIVYDVKKSTKGLKWHKRKRCTKSY